MNASTDPAGHLQCELADQTAHLQMTTPVSDILARGNDLSRRRRRLAVAGLAVAGIAAATGASVVASPGSSPLVPQAQAAWGPSMVNVSASVLDEAHRQCAPVMDEMDLALPATPIAADSRHGETLVVYRDAAAYAICDFRGATVADLQLAGVSQDDSSDLPAGVHAGFVMATYNQESPSDPVTDGAGILRVADGVDRLVIEFDGRAWESAVVEGFALFWMPDGVSDDALDEAVVTTYGVDGATLSTDEIASLY